MLIPANTDFIVMNGMVDPAFQAEVLLLAVTRFRDGSTTEPIQPVVRLAKTMTDWPEGSFCKEIGDNALLHATFKVWGWAGTDATQLYLGTGVWDDGATTDGYAISSAPASFNLLILSGGMPTPGASTGRATYSGPRQVVSDTYGGVPVDACAVHQSGRIPGDRDHLRHDQRQSTGFCAESRVVRRNRRRAGPIQQMDRPGIVLGSS